MSTMTDLRGRHLLKPDYSPRRSYLIDLAAELKAAKKRGTRGAEARRQGDRADLRKGLDADTLRVRGRRLRPGRPRHLHRPRRLAHGPQGDGEGHGQVLGRMYDAIEYRGFGQETAEACRWAASRSTTGSPTSGTDPDPGRLPHLPRARAQGLGEVVFCYLGDARFNMADSYLIGAAKLGMDVRIASPKSLWPRDEIVELARSISSETGAQITITEDVAEAVRGCDVLLTDVWVSMGEADEVWRSESSCSSPTR